VNLNVVAISAMLFFIQNYCATSYFFIEFNKMGLKISEWNQTASKTTEQLNHKNKYMSVLATKNSSWANEELSGR